MRENDIKGLLPTLRLRPFGPLFKMPFSQCSVPAEVPSHYFPQNCGAEDGPLQQQGPQILPGGNRGGSNSLAPALGLDRRVFISFPAIIPAAGGRQRVKMPMPMMANSENVLIGVVPVPRCRRCQFDGVP
ncbi:hypothetical protein niasHS_002058 [Heterodera schachtii]|uniref:Uncharacterized protein n=1 Tax=Heterodera schachtii TaxID=97005 RepID=A0ABD2K5Q6_HETSC